MLLAFAATIGLAAWGSSESPPSLAGASSLTLLAGLLQFGGAWAFSRGQGTANAAHAQASVRNLIKLFLRVQALKSDAEKTLRKRSLNGGELREHLGIVSVELEFVAERAADAVSDWRQFYADAVDRAQREQQEEGF